jgi:phage virion morphogenesis protein
MITLQVADRPALDALATLLRRVADLAPAMRDSADVMARPAESAFHHERDPASGERWHPLAASTIARREAAGHWPGPLLQVTGHLATSLQREYGRDYAAVGTNVVYAAAQHFGMPRGYAGRTRRGAPIPWGDLPPRPFLGLSAEDRREILDLLQDYLSRG